MTHVELFAGIGGIGIAAEWAGFETIAQVEIDPWRSRVLEKRFPGIRRWSDIHDFPGEWDPGPITLISGGFPCPPYSQAGKRLGKNDPRHLWPQMARVIRELKPSWVVAENVAGAVALVLDDEITDLEEAGYSAWPIVLPALAVGAWHERQRLFVVAHLDGSGRGSPRNRRKSIGVSRSSITAKPIRDGTQRDISDVEIERCQRRQVSARSREERERKIDVERADANSDEKHGNASGHGAGEICGNRSQTTDVPGGEAVAYASLSRSAVPFQRDTEAEAWWRTEPCHDEWWKTERGLVRVVHGLPRWLDRHRRRRVAALGDSCVPAQIYPILQAIAEVEER